MTNLIGELRNTYDYIIMDTAPVEASTDSLHFLAMADLALITVRRRKTSYGDLEYLDDWMQKTPLKDSRVVVLDTFDPRSGMFSPFGSRKKAEKKTSFAYGIKRLFLKV